MDEYRDRSASVTSWVLVFLLVIGIISLACDDWEEFEEEEQVENNGDVGPNQTDHSTRLLGAYDPDGIYVFEVDDDGVEFRASFDFPHGTPISMVWLDSETLAVLTVYSEWEGEIDPIVTNDIRVYLLRGNDFEQVPVPADEEWDVEPNDPEWAVWNDHVDASLFVTPVGELWMERCVYTDDTYRYCEETVFMRLSPSTLKSRQRPTDRDAMPSLDAPQGYNLSFVVEPHYSVQCTNPSGDTSYFFAEGDPLAWDYGFEPYALSWVLQDPPTYVLTHAQGSGEGASYYSLITACEAEPLTSKVLENINFGPPGHWAVQEFIGFGEDHNWYLYVDAQPRGVVRAPGSAWPLSTVVIAP